MIRTRNVSTRPTPAPRRWRAVAALLLAAPGCRTPPAPDPPPPTAAATVVTAPIAESSHPEPGDRPYELVWHPRREARDRLEDFDFLLGWSVEADPGLQADFGRSRERPLWGDYVGRLRFHGDPAGPGRILLRPPQPQEIGPRFDCVDLWVHGFDPSLPRGRLRAGPRLSLRLIDAAGAPVILPVGSIDWGGWKLVHLRLPAPLAERLAYPCRFAGFEFTGCRSADPVSFFLDSLSFYLEEFPPLNLPSRPAPNLARAPGEPAGLHDGPGRLDFPVDSRTILPSAEPEAWETVIAAPAVNEILLRSRGPAGQVEYRLDPAAPARGVAVSWDGRELGRFLRGGGPRGRAHADARVEVLRREGDRVHVAYAGGLILEYGIDGPSLIVDVRCRGGRFAGFEVGGYDGPRRAHRLRVPGLGFADGAGPAVGWLDVPREDGEVPLFFSLAVDWTRSHASRWVPGGPTVGSLGAVEYEVATDGRRRDLFERIVLTVAPRLEDVLPRVPNPPGKHRERLHPRVWVDSTGPEDYDREAERTDRFAAAGIEHVLQCHLETVWQDGWESSTFRVRAAPGRGGDASLEQFLGRQRAQGWLPGLFANYLNLHPLNPYWHEDRLLRAPDRDWIEGIPLHYLVKPPTAVEAAAYFRPNLVEQYGPAALFAAGMTDRPPWAFTDYDSRVPGAASLRQAYYCLGELLRTQSDPDRGPVVGESGAEALYAGLMDGYVVRHRQLDWPLLPVFQLERLNPLAAAFGVGPLEVPAGVASFGIDPLDAALDRYLAAQIAYGTMGRLAPDAYGPRRQARSYYLMQALQTRYAGRAPQRIAYWNGEYFVNASEAVARGALERSQLYLFYPDGLEIWVNGSAVDDWDVRVGRSIWSIPPYGWVAAAPDFLALSITVDGRRIDSVEAPRFRYFDGRGSRVAFRGVSSPTPIALRRYRVDDREKIEIIDLGQAGDFGFSALLEPGERIGRVGYLGPADDPRGVGRFLEADGLYRPPSERAASRYVAEVVAPDPTPPVPAGSGDWSRVLDPPD